MSAIFVDLSKAFDDINNDLLPAKPKAYVLSKQVSSFMCSCLRKEDKEFKSAINLAA